MPAANARMAFEAPAVVTEADRSWIKNGEEIDAAKLVRKLNMAKKGARQAKEEATRSSQGITSVETEML